MAMEQAETLTDAAELEAQDQLLTTAETMEAGLEKNPGLKKTQPSGFFCFFFVFFGFLGIFFFWVFWVFWVFGFLVFFFCFFFVFLFFCSFWFFLGFFYIFAQKREFLGFFQFQENFYVHPDFKL